MTKKELEKIAKEENIDIYTLEIPDELNGLYVDNNIFLKITLAYLEQKRVLSHEMGHHFTLQGNNLLKKSGKDLQEFFANAWSYKTELPLEKLAFYKYNDYSIQDILEKEEITENFLNETINYYKERYGNEIIETDDYKITFYPYFKVCKIDENFTEEEY